jgi:very-short-patch-repair endonuclease
MQPRLRSELEARLLALVATSGLPRPVCNRAVMVGDERIEVDFLWSEQRVVVETDGEKFHANSLAFERDRKRDRLLQVDGYRVLRFTHRQVEIEPEAVIASIRELLDSAIG